MAKTFEALAGTHIRDAIPQAVKRARELGESVHFKFNDFVAWVWPEHSEGDIRAMYEAHSGHPILTREQEKEEAERQIAEFTSTHEKAIAEAKVPTEQEMRAQDVPWLKTLDELTEYISALTERPHDYGTCVYAMSMAAVAAFNYVGSTLGCTGFQSSCADLDILRRTRHIAGPFTVIDANDLLYPQYDIFGRLQEFVDKCRPWAAEEAAKLLAETNSAHPNVVAHWKQLAANK